MARTASKVALGLALVALIVVAQQRLDLAQAWIRILDWLRALGPQAQAAFLLIYVLAAVLCVPTTFLDLGAGVAFGLVRGSILVSLGSLLGSSLSFLIARYLTRRWLAKRLGASRSFRAIDRAVGRDGWKVVGLARLSPIFPFWLLNYGFGLTSVPFGHFVLATWAGMLPLVVLYVYAGSVTGELTSLGERGGDRDVLEWVIYGIGFVATVSLTVYVSRRARRAIGEETGE